MQKIKIRAFTLVELIVVITILSILATIAFLSFQNYSKSARDSVRVTNLKDLQKSMQLSLIKNRNYGLPDSYIYIGWFWYQWYVWTWVIRNINIWWNLVDPYDKSYFLYATDEAKRKIQLWAYLEEKNPTYFSYINNSFADIDYSKRYLYTTWDNFWILADCTTNAPIQTFSTGITNLSTYTWSLQITKSDNTWFCWTWSQILDKVRTPWNCVLWTTFVLWNCSL